MTKQTKPVIESGTFQFLSALKKNNEREWFEKHRSDYELAKENFRIVLQEIINEVSKFDTAIGVQDAKKCIFRIHRDIRFSNNKTPYKTNFGASIAPGGRKSPTAGYYIQIAPGNSFIAGGMWQPEANFINAIRQEIDYNAEEFEEILRAKEFKKTVGGLSTEDSLKTAPKGYPKDHPQIELLKLKSFIVVHPLDDKLVKDSKFVAHSISTMKAMYPLLKFLRRACD